MSTTRQHIFLDILVVGYVVLILLLTLTPAPVTGPDPAALEIFCLLCGARAVADAVANVLLFVPLGFLLALRFSASRAILAAALLSLAIEVLQLHVPGRYAVLSDLAVNTLGAAFGIVLVRTRVRWLWGDSARRRTELALGGSVVLAAFLITAGWMFEPSVPDRPLYGQWTAEFGNMEHYEGEVLEARIGALPAPSRFFDDSGRVRDELRRGMPVRVRFVAGPPPAGLAPIFSVFDDRGERVLLIGADGHDLAVAMRRVADLARLDRPDLRLRGALREVSVGDTLAVEVNPQDSGAHRLTLARIGSGEEVASGIRGHTAARSWSLLLYIDGWPGGALAAVDLLWLLLLGLPLGWWAPGRRIAVGSAAVYVVALATVPSYFPLLPTGSLEYAAAISGVALGRLVRSGIPKNAAPDPG